MIRLDFVSNSSSSSYIISVPKNYPIKTFIKKVSKNCVDKKKKFHIKNLLESDETTLKYYIQNASLLFLGEVYVCDKKYKIYKDKCPLYEEKNYWEERFNSLKNRIERNKNNKSKEFDSEYRLLDENTIECTYHVYESGYVILGTDSSFSILNYMGKCSEDFIKQQSKFVVSNIKKFLRNRVHNKITYFCGDEPLFRPDIYVIDRDTIKRTEEMLKSGIKMRFQKWENINKLKKELEDKSTVICMRVAKSGDGMDPYYIYNETDRDVFEDIPVKVLNKEIL